MIGRRMAPNPNRAMLSPKKSFVSMSVSSELRNGADDGLRPYMHFHADDSSCPFMRLRRFERLQIRTLTNAPSAQALTTSAPSLHYEPLHRIHCNIKDTLLLIYNRSSSLAVLFSDGTNTVHAMFVSFLKLSNDLKM